MDFIKKFVSQNPNMSSPDVCAALKLPREDYVYVVAGYRAAFKRQAKNTAPVKTRLLTVADIVKPTTPTLATAVKQTNVLATQQRLDGLLNEAKRVAHDLGFKLNIDLYKNY